ncbi:MAG: protein translocase subunit SecD [Bacteroidetes bacterium]|nr:protein translocase subunit SecD [Bacteroidota bacterium]
MKLKSFFWALTITLVAVCIYQLSFTWVAVKIENDAAKEAEVKAKDLQKKAKQTGDSALLPNGVYAHFNQPSGMDIAKAAFVNHILKLKAEDKENKVFLGNDFGAVKRRALAFGLDLVGGMSVTMEVSVPELIESNVSNPRNIEFIKSFEQAKQRVIQGEDDFLKIFVEEYKKISNGKPLNKLFSGARFKGKSDDQIVIDIQDVINNSIDRIELILEKRINQFGVAQPNIQKDAQNNRIYIELPGVQDEVTLTDKLKSTANLEFYALYSKPDLGKQFEEADRISRLKEKSLAELDKQDTLNLDKSKSKGKGIFDYLKIENEGGNFGYVLLKDKYNLDILLKRTDVLSSFSADVKLMWSAKPEQKGSGKAFLLYAVEVPDDRQAEVSGKDISQAIQGNDETGKVTVDLEMTEEGAGNWSKMTKKNIGKPVAITMDNVVYSAPIVREVLSKKSQISGTFTFEEAQDLASLLNGGSLPVPCVIVEKTKVGPTIGEENTRAGIISFGVALLVIFVYMFFYYGKAGIVADIALFANMLFIFGALASFGAVLTLAGIAGIVLTIGMSVDANVLIYERIREELANGKDQESALNVGFSKALSSIIDANVTTLLTAIVLKIFGTGPIESFATTLIIGIFSSVFSAVIISRLIFTWMMGKKQSISFSSKLTQNAFKNININFIDKRKLAYLISGALVFGSIILVMTKGINQSVEFSGGRTIPVTFEKSASDKIEKIKENLASTMPRASIEVKTKSSNNVVEITTNYLLSDPEGEAKVNKALKDGLALSEGELGKAKIDFENDRYVSSNVADQTKSSAVISMSISLAIIFLYIFIRFGTWQYSLSAIIALFHDVLIVLGIFSLLNGILPFNMDMDQALVAALLTVVGYSINDTVVVFDRIRENLSWKKDADFKGEINGALNSTLSRTLNTSFTTIIVLVIIFFFGGSAIKGFIFALLVGIVVGTYSSLMIATPLLVDFTKKITVKK